MNSKANRITASTLMATAASLLMAGSVCATELLSTQGLWGDVQPEPPSSVSKQSDPLLPGTFRYIELSPIFFKHDSALLTRRGQQSMDAAVNYILAQESIRRLIIEGNTDDIGSHNFNYTLSDKRIKTIRAYMTAQGVDAELITVQGRGETQPVDENWTRAGRARNRQVAIYVVQWDRGEIDPY